VFVRNFCVKVGSLLVRVSLEFFLVVMICWLAVRFVLCCVDTDGLIAGLCVELGSFCV
jgi:hypothetical protein